MDFNLRKESFLTLISFVVIIVIGFWNINLLLPLIFILLIISFSKKKIQIQFSILDIGFIAVLIGELVAFAFSTNRFNSLPELISLFVILSLYFFYKKQFNKRQYYNAFICLFFFYSFLLLIITLVWFLIFNEKYASHGFKELNDFKYDYNPFRVLNNIWVTVILLFLPFIASFLIKQKKMLFKVLAFINLLLLIFCILVSFSRGAYLSLTFFIFSLNVLLFNLFKFKKIILFNLIGLLFFIVISLPIMESVLTTISFNKTISQKRSTSNRLEGWSNLINSDIITDHFFFGWGQNNYVLAHFTNPQLEEDLQFSSLSNSTYLQLIIEKGLIGILGYLILIASLVIISFKRLKSNYVSRHKKILLILFVSGIFAFLIRELTFSSLFSNNSVYFLFFHLLFLLIPFDISLKEIIVTGRLKKRILVALIIIFSLLSYGNIKHLIIDKYNNQFIVSFNENKLSKSLDFIDKALELDPNNIILNKHRVLALARSCISIEISAKTPDFLSFTNKNIGKLSIVKNNLERIIKISPYDDELYHNLGWVYFALDNRLEANKAFKKAIKINPYNSTFYLSKLLFDIKTFNKVSNSDLTKVIQFSPEILESFFYKEFFKKYRNKAIESKKEAIEGLEKNIKKSDNTILKARLARLILDERPDEALRLLNEVTNELPNLNRPWLYKGYLYYKKGDSVLAHRNYNTSLFLRNDDLLCRKYLSEFYKNIGDKKRYILNLEYCLLEYKNIKSETYSKNKNVFSLDIVKNSYIPFQLLLCTSPDINVKKELFYVEEYYRKE